MDHMHHTPIDQTVQQFRIPLPAPESQPLSEFNHHLAGLVVIILAVSMMLLYANPRQFRVLKYVWPSVLLAFGVYLVIYSDPPFWPSGYASLAESLRQPEVMQHKIFALLLVLLGGVELFRSSGWARSELWKYTFPVLAAFGALFLLWHKHGGLETGHSHGSMDTHTLVLFQHILYMALGVLIVLSLVLYDAGKLRGRWGPYIWPSLTFLLGAALVLYRE